MASSVINSVDDFKEILRNTPRSMIHCAVQRKCYKHHYIALGDTFCEKCITCDIIHFAKDDWWWEGRVKLVKHYNIQIDITKGLSVYKNDGYPRNNDDYSIAYGRFQRLQSARRSYLVSLNNCEHIVNYILTGHAVLYQHRNASVFKRLFSDLIDLFTEGLCRNLSAAVVNGLATSLFMIGFLYYYYLQMKALSDNESKCRGWVEKLQKRVFSCIGRTFKNKVKKLSPDEQRFLNTLMCLLTLDPEKVIDSTSAKALLQKAVPRLPNFTTVATGILTFIVEGFFSISNARSLRRDLQDNFINDDDFRRQILNAILFVQRVILTSLIMRLLFSSDKKPFFHPISAFLYGFCGSFASRLITCTMEVFCRLYRYLINPENDLTQ